MTPADADKVVDHIMASWPTAELPGQLPDLWRKDLAPCDFECAILAVDQLRHERDAPPTAHQLLETWKAIHVGARHPALPAVDPRDYPESPYLRESKKLIYTEKGRHVLMLPPERLTPEELTVRKAILEVSKRHELVMNQGLKPNDEMLVEVAALVTALEQLPDPLPSKRQRQEVKA